MHPPVELPEQLRAVVRELRMRGWADSRIRATIAGASVRDDVTALMQVVPRDAPAARYIDRPVDRGFRRRATDRMPAR